MSSTSHLSSIQLLVNDLQAWYRDSKRDDRINGRWAFGMAFDGKPVRNRDSFQNPERDLFEVSSTGVKAGDWKSALWDGMS